MDNQNKNIIALVDCNNFYASCERVFKPELNNKPVVILSNNDGNCVALSNEAKALGIKVGTPYFQVEKLIKEHGGKVFSSNYTLYGDISERVHGLLSEFSECTEHYSIDEAFLGLNGYKGNLEKIGREIRTKILKWTGIPVSVGFARTKTLSKVANRFAKKTPSMHGVFDLIDHPQLDELLMKIMVNDIWGIGTQYSAKLNNININTAYDLKNASDIWIRKYLGGIVGLRTVWELRGISCIPFELKSKAKKQIVSSRSFGKSVESLHHLEEAVSVYTATAAIKLRKQNSIASGISVFVGTNPFREDEPQYYKGSSKRLPEPTNNTTDLIKEAIILLQNIYKAGFKYKRAGVMLLDIIPESDLSSLLFIDNDVVRKKQILMKTIDKINYRFGQGAIQNSSHGIYRVWEMRREYLTPRYTTNWNELLTVTI